MPASQDIGTAMPEIGSGCSPYPAHTGRRRGFATSIFARPAGACKNLFEHVWLVSHLWEGYRTAESPSPALNDAWHASVRAPLPPNLTSTASFRAASGAYQNSAAGSSSVSIDLNQAEPH